MMRKGPAISAHVEYKSVTIRLTNGDGKPFWVNVTEEGLKFYSEVSSSGGLLGNPVSLTGPEMFEMIASDGQRKEFAERAAFNRKSGKPSSANSLKLPIGLRRSSMRDK